MYVQELRVLSDGVLHELCLHDALQMLQRMDASQRRQRLLTP